MQSSGEQKKRNDVIYKIGFRFVLGCSLLLTGILCVSAFLTTAYSEDMTSQLVLFRWDHFFVNVLGVVILVGLLGGIAVFVCKNPGKRKVWLLRAVMIWQAAAGIILVVFSKTVPAADAMSVYSIAEELAAGNLNVIHPVDSYLSYYPQQIGLAAFYEVIIRVWNLLPVSLPAYHIIKCMNIVFGGVIIAAQYKTVGVLFSSDRADCFYLILAGFNLPLIFYTSFVYGEIPSFALFSVGIWGILAFLRKERRYLLIVSLLAFSFSVLLRKNTLILIIAVLLVVLFEWIRRRQKLLLVFGLVCGIAAFSILPLTQAVYELRAGNSLSSGVPAISYLAMGMQESSRANGWYNGFNFNTYQESGMDYETTARVSREAINERLAVFQERPSYGLAFYRDKFLSQWADGTYACRQATLATFGGRSSFFQAVYEGHYSSYLITFCNAWQNVLYLGTFLFCIIKIKGNEVSFYLKKKTDSVMTGLPVFVLLIGVIGGFLFHMIWEANSRYIFPYGLLLMPYCAYALDLIFPASRKSD